MLKFVSRAILCLIFIFLFGKGVMAQEPLVKSEYSYRRYSVNDGLPENSCWNVYKDSKGFIWVSTYNGFTRYDGKQFIGYWQDKQTNVKYVTENKEGNITALAFSYYAVLDPVADTLKLIYNTGWRLISNTSQNMPAGYFFYQSTETGQVALFQPSDTGLVKVFEHESFNKITFLRKPYWDTENRKFYIPTEHFIYIINEANHKVEDSIPNQSIYTIFSYKKSIGAIGTDGIYKFENQKFTLIYKKTFILQPSGIQTLTDKENRLLIRDGENIYRFNGINLESVFKSFALYHILFDAENNLWVATYDGLFNLFNLQFRNYLFSERNVPYTLCIDENKIMIGTFKGHLYSNINDVLKEENVQRKEGYTYFQGFSAKAGNFLFFPGGYFNGGMLQFDGKKGIWMNIPEMVYTFVLPMPDNTVLLGSQQGIIFYNYLTNKIIRTILKDELYLQPNYAVLDKSGKIYVGGSRGITVVDKDSVYLMDKAPNFLACRIMLKDKDGKIWAESNNRLFSVKDDSIQHEYTFDFPIRGMYVTKDNLLIVLTQKGVNIKKEEDENFIYFDKNNGYTGEQIEFTDLIEDLEGNIWFLANKSLVRFNPNELLNKTIAPKLYVQQIMTSKDNINWANTNQGILNFGYQNNNIKFQYIGLSYSAVENVRYHYRLLGFQNAWSEPAKNREVTFNNLPPGNYVFEIYADAGTDDSRCETQSFAFSIKPAFWQTSWFLIACISFLILASSGVTLNIQRRKNKILFEKLRAEKELNELRINSIRLKAIPHFNANVLAAIEYYLTNRTKEEAMHILGIYSDFTFKTLSEVDKAARPLSEELAYVKMYLDLEKIRFLEKFDFRIQVEEGVDKNVQLPNMILHTYCENAVKHGLMPLKSGGLLTINVSQRNQIIIVSVEDNGVGRAYAAQNPQMHSSKQGLSILNRQIEIYNQFNQDKITHQVEDLLKAGKPNGTVFRVEVPVGYNYIV